MRIFFKKIKKQGTLDIYAQRCIIKGINLNKREVI